MKFLYTILIYFFCAYNSDAQTAASFSDINDHTVVVDSLAGKKLLVMLLPLERDTAMINQLLRFQSAHAAKVRIIGLVNWGGSYPSADSLQSMYSDVISAGIILTQGLPANTSTNNQREWTLKWVSEMNYNRAANLASLGVKYLISEGGKLYAQPGSSTPVDSRLMDNLASTKVPGDSLSH